MSTVLIAKEIAMEVVTKNALNLRNQHHHRLRPQKCIN